MKRPTLSLRRPTWHRDAGGFSGGWYPTSATNLQASVLYQRAYGIYLDLAAPLLGDLRIGWNGHRARTGPHLRHHGRRGRIEFERRPFESASAA